MTRTSKQPEYDPKRNPIQPDPSIGCSMCLRTTDVVLKWDQRQRSYFCKDTNECIDYMTKKGMF